MRRAKRWVLLGCMAAGGLGGLEQHAAAQAVVAAPGVVTAPQGLPQVVPGSAVTTPPMVPQPDTVVTPQPVVPQRAVVFTPQAVAPPGAVLVAPPPVLPPGAYVPRVPMGPTLSPEGRLRLGLISGGLAMFAVPYVVTMISAGAISSVCAPDTSVGCTSARWPLYLPVIGPFIQMGFMNSNGAGTGQALLAVDGILQAGGVAMFFIGLAVHAKAPPPNQVARRLELAPYTPAGGAGLLAMGRF